MTYEATFDVLAITKYIEMKFGRPRADLFQEDMKIQMLKLGTMHNTFSKTGIQYRGYNIHKKPFSPSIIFYISIDSQKEVHILRVIREESDWPIILRQNQNYTFPN